MKTELDTHRTIGLLKCWKVTMREDEEANTYYLFIYDFYLEVHFLTCTVVSLFYQSN